ncbi:TonB-dependent receptor family protein [Reichenbachiella agarivorans]|uniref:TonB-dependent receptor family protein n=1 Tax=Reichenbachiella agarivorans TaxID=2979464 RepID=A0ABY6CTF6_9BACT|nr:outer membrane beta-barrel family protein [Reichenbachiella agarivorans]UXP32668.1 TonB-dependent receptor family protein [Reichenbachiella agarivorans]
MKISICTIALFCLFHTGLFAQNSTISISGTIKDKVSQEALSYVNVILKNSKDSTFVTGSITNDQGLFTLEAPKSGEYLVEISFLGYLTIQQKTFIGSQSKYLDLGDTQLEEDVQTLGEVIVTGQQDAVSETMDKKTYTVSDNISQSGGSVLQSMSNLPGVTVQDGKIQLRGNEKITVLIDGKQTALTGFGSQTGLDNLPASAIEKIEIINNPSAKYDANGNAGIINIVMKKEKKTGLNGKAGLSTGLGALWVRKENLPTIRPQYQMTPKINPSLSLNYRKDKVNFYLQADNLYTQTLNKNEFVTRTYDDGTVIHQQSKRNRNTNFFTSKAGLDYQISDVNSFSASVLFGSEKIIDHGDEPFFNQDLSQRLRLWQYVEDELKTTAMATGSFQHQFRQPGHTLSAGLNYTFHRENEQYFFDNILPSSSSKDAFKLLSDEHVADLMIDYVRPLRYGRVETGLKFRKRVIPTDMQFFPGTNSPLDADAGGWATYNETIPALYGNYIYETKKIEAELGLRLEYFKLQYDVNPGHNTYKSDGYDYTQPFPSIRFAYKINDNNRLTTFYNRRVDRPNEVDIRIFPKYDDAEIIKVGNPALRAQFTDAIEIGYKTNWNTGYFYSALYHRMANATISRISTTVDSTNLIYAVFQNIGKSYNSGLEIVFSQEVNDWLLLNLNLNGYHNQINAYTVTNLYPVENVFSVDKQEMFSGNIKLNSTFQISSRIEAQLTAIYLAPDLIPQGRIGARYTLNMGIKSSIQDGKGELFLNATDLLNSMVIKQTIDGNNFSYTSSNYYETQVIRLGYNYKF